MTSPNANSYRAFIIRKKILQLVAENYVISASMVSHTLLLSYATVLRHLRILKDEDLVDIYKEGRTLKAKFKANAEEIEKMYSEYIEYLKAKENVYMNKNETIPSLQLKETKERR
jgi:DNA-binding transcriptional ArsR family regulator